MLVYYPIKKTMLIPWILFGSWLFYAFWRIDFLFLLIFVSAINYFAGLLMDRVPDGGREHGSDTGSFDSFCHRLRAVVSSKRFIVVTSVVVNLSILGYFKYANFGVESFNSLLERASLPALPWTAVILPVGISFYVFQAMSYSIDVYRGDARSAKNFMELSAYIALFPQLIAGPIVRYKDIADQLTEPHRSPGRLARGLRRFMFGFAKKIILADSLAALVSGSFALAHPHAADAWIGVLAYSLQLYLDFAAYSDMAIGLGLMLGFRFRENFRQPYHSASITEFWQRWHISLSTWLRDYLYIPLGGNRVSPWRTRVNLFVVMLLGGLWHGANWTFLLWGAWHGLLLLAERSDDQQLRLRRRLVSRMPGFWLYRIITLVFVAIGWVFFRSPDAASALGMIWGLFGANGLTLSDAYAWQFGVGERIVFFLALSFVIAEPALVRWFRSMQASRTRAAWLHRLEGKIITGGAALGFFILAVVKLLADSYSPFLYFQF